MLFDPQQFVTMEAIEAAAARAQDRHADVLIVDPIDRIETRAVDNEYLALKRVVRRLKELAPDHQLVLVIASQLNRHGREGDRLTVYRPPQLHHMQGGATKEQEADVVLGLWRPIRQRRATESLEAYRSVLQGARGGLVEPADFLRPNTMGIICLKHRTRGESEGARCLLRVQHGRVIDPLQEERAEELMRNRADGPSAGAAVLTVAKLPALWRMEARLFDRYAPTIATLLRDKADEIEQALREAEGRRAAVEHRAEQFVIALLANGARRKTVEIRRAGHTEGLSHAELGRALRVLRASGEIDDFESAGSV